MSKEATSFFPNNPAALNKLGKFVSDNGISPEQFSEALHKAFGKRPGEPAEPSHHKDPAQSVIIVLEGVMKFAERASMLSNPMKLSPSPSPGASNKKDEEEKNAAPSMMPKFKPH